MQQQYLCSLFNTICTIDANRLEQKDQVLKTFVYCMAKLSTKH